MTFATNAKEEFAAALRRSLQPPAPPPASEGVPTTFVRLTLSDRKSPLAAAPDGPASPWDHLKTVSARLVDLPKKGGVHCQLQYRYTTNDQVKNHPLADTPAVVMDLIGSAGFRKAALVTVDGTVSELTLRRGAGKYREIPPTATTTTTEAGTSPVVAPVAAHDRQKNVPIDVHAPFLRALKITTEGGRPLAGKADKLRQVRVRLVRHTVCATMTCQLVDLLTS
jgi:hypothetical protein